VSLPHLILGLLSDEPRSGYDLNKAFQESINYFWTTDQSQIYRTLQKLKRSGWVRVEDVIQTDSPNKKVYYVTEEGEHELKRWLATPLSLSDAPVREGWLGQLYFGDKIALGDLEHVLDVYIEEQKGAIAALRALQSRVAKYQTDPRPEVQLRLMTIDYGVRIQSVLLEWIEQARSRIIDLDETS
jgi:DNA-binding PadR family transcriptional regulator